MNFSSETFCCSGLLQRIGELECELKGLQEEVQKCHIDQKAIQTQLAEKAKVNLSTQSSSSPI